VALAREDPFVADALEGFHAYPEIDHSIPLDTIAQRIKHTKRERRRWLIPNLTVTAIAASFLVILTTYGVIMQVQKKNEESVLVMVAPDSILMTDTVVNDIAMESEAGTPATEETKNILSEPASKPAARESAPITSSVRKETKVQPGTEQSESSASDVTATEPIRITQPTSIPVAPPSVDGIKIMAEDKTMETQPVLAGAASKESSRARRDEGYYANQMDPDMMRSVVTGSIVDVLTGAPIAPAKLQVSYTNQLFFADAQGQFELSIPESEAVLQVSSPGFTDSIFIVKQGEENMLVGLNVAVKDLLNAPQRIIKGPVSPNKDPAIESFLNIHRHITSSSTLQLTTDPATSRRKVTVAFKVNNEGRPKNISVMESSRDKTYDGEAVRLIESGPEWYCPGGESPCVRQYTFYFR
jgi:TonB family protein